MHASIFLLGCRLGFLKILCSGQVFLKYGESGLCVRLECVVLTVGGFLFVHLDGLGVACDHLLRVLAIKCGALEFLEGSEHLVMRGVDCVRYVKVRLLGGRTELSKVVCVVSDK